MSYILDALRRLEQDKERAKRGTNPMEAVLVPDLDVVGKSERRRLGWVFVGLVIVVTVVAATYWITRRTLGPPAELAREGKALHPASVRPGNDRPSPLSSPGAAPSSPQHLPLGREWTATLPRPAAVSTPGVSAGPATAGKPAEAPDPAPVVVEPVPIQGDERRRPSVSSGEGTLPAGQENPSLVRDTSEGEIIQAWRGSEIKINAIAYSREGKNRFAVVNLKTVHEGSRFEDLVVVKIQEKGIIFEKAGTKYKVLLGRR